MPRPRQRSSVTRSAERAALLIALLAARTPAAQGQGGVSQQSTPASAPIRAQPECAPARTALVLAGGGAKGAAHVGVIKVLDSLGVHPDMVIGTSIGSIVGALYASGYTGAEIDSITTAYPIGSLFQPYRPRLPPLIGVGLRPFAVWESWGEQLTIQNGALYEGDVLSLMNAMLLRGNLLARGDFDALPIPYRAIATDLSTRELVVLGKGDLAQAVRASFAIPLVFTPVRMDGRLLIDGGIALNVPIAVARQMGAERVIVSRLDNSSQRPKGTGSTLGTASLLIDFLFRQPLDSLHETDLMVSTQTGQFAALDFAPARIASLVQLGHDRAAQVFRDAACRPPATPAPVVKPLPPLVGMIMPTSTTPDDAITEALTLRIESRGPLNTDSLRHGVQRASYSDPFLGVWLNPVPEDSAHVAFRPNFLDRPERSVGVGLDYVTSVGPHLWTGVIDRRLGTSQVEGTALLEVSEIRQELTLGARRTTRLLGLTTHPTARFSVAREQVRFFGADHVQLPGREVDETRLLLGFERALSWGGRYRWGLESHLWKMRDEPLLNAVGAHGQFWWLRSTGTPIIFMDADINSRYERVLFTANTIRHFWKRWTWIPSVRVGFGNDLPAQETFSLGGYNGFPGYKVFEARGTVENSTSMLLKYHLTGPLSLTAESVGGAIFDADTVRGALTLPVDKFVDGNRYGIEVETPIGPMRLDIGHNTTGRQQATISIGTWR